MDDEKRCDKTYLDEKMINLAFLFDGRSLLKHAEIEDVWYLVAAD